MIRAEENAVPVWKARAATMNSDGNRTLDISSMGRWARRQKRSTSTTQACITSTPMVSRQLPRITPANESVRPESPNRATVAPLCVSKMQDWGHFGWLHRDGMGKSTTEVRHGSIRCVRETDLAVRVDLDHTS